MSDRKETQDLQSAFSLHRSGRLAEAAQLYRKIIKRSPGSVHAFHSLGLIEAAGGNLAEAARLMSRSVLLAPSNIPFIENYATVLCQLGDFKTALDVALKGCSIDRANKHLLYVSATSFLRLQRLDESLAQFDRLLLQDPDQITALNERSIVLMEMKRYEAALDGVEKAISRNPQFAEAYLNKGVACGQLGRHDEALAAFNKALALNPGLGNAWLGCGNSLLAQCRYDDALVTYDKALSLDSEFDAVWLGRGNALFGLKRLNEAAQSYERALALNPGWAEAWLGVGNVCRLSRDYEKALSAYDRALAIEPTLENAWIGRGVANDSLKRYDDAFADYDKAFALHPTSLSAESCRLNSKMRLCNRENVSSEIAHFVESVRNGDDSTEPFTFLGISSSVEDQLKLASCWVRKTCPPAKQPLWKGDIYKHDKVRIGYVSADFHEHATAYLMAGVFENHDRTKFDVTAISLGQSDGSPMRRRLEQSFNRFIDAGQLGDSEVAAQIRAAEIDILVDLKGFTQNARTNIFAQRPAPIQVSFLGYPGTMGANYIDYIMADQVVIPASQRDSYVEKIVYLPNCYQPNDTTRLISDKAVGREEFAIPADAFVFCCFNNTYKILPNVFDSWMRILAKVPGSVLWLFEANATAAGNLKREAELRGVSAERIVFAERMPLADHLARHRLADLFLDTLPYNAHTTASDALWAGLPVLTRIGTTFAGRVAASLLTALDLRELIVETSDDYERMAVDLAVHPEKLAALKRKLADNCLTAPLFNTGLSTKDIESAYGAIYERHQAGLPPDHIMVRN